MCSTEPWKAWPPGFFLAPGPAVRTEKSTMTGLLGIEAFADVRAETLCAAAPARAIAP